MLKKYPFNGLILYKYSIREFSVSVCTIAMHTNMKNTKNMVDNKPCVSYEIYEV